MPPSTPAGNLATAPLSLFTGPYLCDSEVVAGHGVTDEGQDGRNHRKRRRETQRHRLEKRRLLQNLPFRLSDTWRREKTISALSVYLARHVRKLPVT